MVISINGSYDSLLWFLRSCESICRLMKSLFTFKAKVFITLSLFLFNIASASANNFVLEHDGLLDPRAIGKINELGTELKSKTGINAYVTLKGTYPTIQSEDMKEKLESIKLYEKNVIQTLQKPYALLSMSFEDSHINLQASADVEALYDKDDILDIYIIPLLASKDKNGELEKISAAMLNGYGELCDEIAESKGVTLESSMGSGGTTFSAIWKVFMYTLVLVGILLYTYIVMKEKKKGN